MRYNSHEREKRKEEINQAHSVGLKLCIVPRPLDAGIPTDKARCKQRYSLKMIVVVDGQPVAVKALADMGW